MSFTYRQSVFNLVHRVGIECRVHKFSLCYSVGSIAITKDLALIISSPSFPFNQSACRLA